MVSESLVCFLRNPILSFPVEVCLCVHLRRGDILVAFTTEEIRPSHGCRDGLQEGLGDLDLVTVAAPEPTAEHEQIGLSEVHVTSSTIVLLPFRRDGPPHDLKHGIPKSLNG